jgi:hypothetical protein
MMATRSTISAKINGRTVGVYVHWDGSPDTRIPLLLNHYNSQELAEGIIALGAISSLHPVLAPDEGKVHTFDTPITGVTVAYHRDRGEEFVQLKGMNAVEGVNDAEWHYHFENGHWLYKEHGAKKWVPCDTSNPDDGETFDLMTALNQFTHADLKYIIEDIIDALGDSTIADNLIADIKRRTV